MAFTDSNPGETKWNIDDERMRSLSYYMKVCEMYFLNWDLEGIISYLNAIKRVLNGIDPKEEKKIDNGLKELEKIKRKLDNVEEKDYEKRKRIKELFESIYDKISLIEKTFSDLDSSDQREITIDIKDSYSDKLKESNSTYSALNELFKEYIPLEKSKSARYRNLSKAFVLFFFDDCTIGRKG